MYVKHCKLSRHKQLELLKYFVAGATARTAAELADIHKNTAIRFFYKIAREDCPQTATSKRAILWENRIG